ASTHEDARVGLAGPLWGLGATLVCAAAYYVTHAPIWAAIAQLSGMINLFNLLPFWQLDGGRGFRSLSKPQRWMACMALAGLWALTSSGLLLLLLIFGVLRALAKDAPEESDTPMLLLYIGLAASLCYLSLIPV